MVVVVLVSKYSRLVKNGNVHFWTLWAIKVNPDYLNLYRFTSFSFQESEGQYYVTKHWEQWLYVHDITCDSEIGPSLGIKGHRFVHKKVSLSQESQSSHHEGTYFIDRLCAHSRRTKCKMIYSAEFAPTKICRWIASMLLLPKFVKIDWEKNPFF